METARAAQGGFACSEQQREGKRRASVGVDECKALGQGGPVPGMLVAAMLQAEDDFRVRKSSRWTTVPVLRWTAVPRTVVQAEDDFRVG